jgi:hypothetical protein
VRIGRAVRALPGLARRGRRVRFADLTRFGSALRGRQRWSAVRAVVDGAYVIATLHLRGLAPLLRAPSGMPDGDPAEVRRIADAVDAGLGLLPVAPTCLRRSVTLIRELHRRQMGATMHIGVRQGDDAVEAHAWVQIADEVVNDEPDVVATYVRLSTSRAEQLQAKFG